LRRSLSSFASFSVVGNQSVAIAVSLATSPSPWRRRMQFCISVNTTWGVTYYPGNFPALEAKMLRSWDMMTRQSQHPENMYHKELVYKTVEVPGCAHHADSLYTYPVATECHCGKCDSDSTDCTVRGLRPTYCSFNGMKE
ncbi:Follitropin subunit beta, partial [Galemys pyrenaicus]